MWSSCNIYRALIHRWQVFFSAPTPTPPSQRFVFFFFFFFPFEFQRKPTTTLKYLSVREGGAGVVGRVWVGVGGGGEVLGGVFFLFYCPASSTPSHTSPSPSLLSLQVCQGLDSDSLGLGELVPAGSIRGAGQGWGTQVPRGLRSSRVFCPTW